MFWTRVLQLIEDGQKVFLAMVAENTRHSPGTQGARLLVSEEGETAGTIGGGIMELRLLEYANGVLHQREFQPRLQTLHHRKTGPGEKSGMICAGSQTNLYALCHPCRDRPTVRRLALLLEEGRSGTLTINPAGLQIREEPPDLSRPQRELQREGESWEYREELLNRKRIAILGGGHCALALSRAMQQLGYEVQVFDDRPEVETLRQNTFARRIDIVEDYAQAGPRIEYPELTAVVVMTAAFPSDMRALAGLAGMPFPFTGLLGSAAKLGEIFRQLERQGVRSGGLSNLHAPVGLPIGSNTPQEIAVSVAAHILQARKERQKLGAVR